MISRLPEKNKLFFPELWPFKNKGILNLSAIFLKNYLSKGLETWSADKGWWVDYLIKLKKIILFFQSYGPFKQDIKATYY